MGDAKLAGADGAEVVLDAATNSSGVTVGGQLALNSSSAFTVLNATADNVFSSSTESSSLNSVATIDVSTAQGATDALGVIDGALGSINNQRANLGAIQNRFVSTITNLSTSSVNLTASRSSIQDADFAQETANLARAQILQQAGVAMVAQANQMPQAVLQLLK